MFKLPTIDEKRGSLASVKGFPLPNDFEADADQPVRFTGVGNIEGIIPRRGGQGIWVLTYEVDVTEVIITPL